MTDREIVERLPQLRELLAKATPGDWHVDPKAPEESFFEDVNVLRHDGLAVAVAVQNGDISPDEAAANGKLIAVAKVALPTLLDTLSAQQGRIEGLDHDKLSQASMVLHQQGYHDLGEYLDSLWNPQ